MKTRSPKWSAWCLALGLALLLPGAAPARPGEGEVRDELERIFDRPEFRRRPLFNWEWLERLLAWLASLHSEQPALFWLILIGCLVLLALLLGHIVWTVWSAFSWRPRLGDDAPAAAERRRESARLGAAAEERARAGDFTEAIRLLFLSLLYAFDESGRLRLQPSLTNREYLGLFEGRPAVRRELGVFVDVLDANWYGQRPTSGAQYEECRTLYDAVRREG
jgi:hypothetical protein